MSSQPTSRVALRSPRSGWATIALLSTLLAGAGCAGRAGADLVAPAVPFKSPDAVGGGCPKTVAAAGDMNQLTATQATGKLAQGSHADVVAVLGDQQYPAGSLTDYRTRYDRTGWGQLKSKTRPVPGNHEYMTPGASGYFTYFGHPPAYYAYDVGCGWRGYALNSEVGIADQARWLRVDLAAHPMASVLAYWHKPRYSSGTKHGSDPALQPFWDALAHRRGVVLNGHEHNYERFAPRGGMREFVVGTGGSATYPFASNPVAGSVKRIAHTPGILILIVQANGSYHWSFRNRASGVLDSGHSP